MSSAAADAGAVLTLRDITRTWPRGGGLAPTSLDLAAGDLVVIRGRSGSGKSTLLAVVAGWCRPDGGALLAHGAAFDARGAAWSRLAVVPQVIGLSPELSMRENIELPLRLADVGRTERRARVVEVLHELDLHELADRLPREVSMGQRQRAAIARALVVRATITLVDEPTSHQDAAHAELVVDALRSASARGGALLVATHDPVVVDAATRVIDLDGD